MRKTCIAIIAILATACAPKYKVTDNPVIIVLDYPHFEKSNSDLNLSVDKKHLLSKVHLDNNKFVLKHDGNAFFYGDMTHHYYLEQIFRERFLFITINNNPNRWSSVSLIPRDSVIMYDMHAGRSYHLNAEKFRISAVKFKYPISSTETIIGQQKKGYTVQAIIDSVDTVNDELHLLLEDNKSRAILKLKPFPRI